MIRYQLNYETYDFEFDEIQDYLGYKAEQQLFDYLLKIGIRAYIIKTGGNANYPGYDGKYFIEFLYVYGCGGRYAIVRNVPVVDLMRNIKNNKFKHYKLEDTHISRYNFDIIKQHRLNKICEMHKINKLIDLIRFSDDGYMLCSFFYKSKF